MAADIQQKQLNDEKVTVVKWRKKEVFFSMLPDYYKDYREKND